MEVALPRRHFAEAPFEVFLPLIQIDLKELPTVALIEIVVDGPPTIVLAQNALIHKR
jgi:hypothetical protein